MPAVVVSAPFARVRQQKVAVVAVRYPPPWALRMAVCHSMRGPSLGQEDPLEEGMATHSSILAWKIPWTEEPGGLQSMGLQSETQLTVHARARAHTHTHTHTEFTRNFCIGLQMFISYVNNR